MMLSRTALFVCLTSLFVALVEAHDLPFADSPQDTNTRANDSVTWSFSAASKTLTIGGTGMMADYSTSSLAPWSSLNGIATTIIINNGVESIGSYAFYNFSFVTSLNISSSVKRIGQYSFCHCRNLSSLAIPEGIIYIGIEAFSSCTSLVSVKLPSTLNTVNSNVFLYDNELERIEVNETNSTFVTDDGVLIDKRSKTIVSCPAKKKGRYSISSWITTIGQLSFAYCRYLTSIDIPDNVTAISNYAFKGCSNLTSLIVPSKVKTIPHQFCESCTNLVSVSLPENLSSINTYAFSGCGNLTTINFPVGLKSIGDNSFSSCKGLKSIHIPASVELIGDSTFSGCEGLTSFEVDRANNYFESYDGVLIDKVNHTIIKYPSAKKGSFVIPSFVASVGRYAFQSSQISSIIIPDSVTSILSYAFSSCNSMKSVLIQSTAVSIRDNAFSWCKSLTTVSYHGSSNPGTSNAFSGCNSLSVICVSEAYNSLSFCGKTITCKSSSCQTVFSQCYDSGVNGTQCILRKKEDVIEWENQTNGCIKFLCDDGTGELFTSSQCNNDKEVCVNDKCIAEDDDEDSEMADKKWVVEIKMNESDSFSMTSEEIVSDISKKSGVDADDITIGVEYDENGKIVRVIVYVNDESKADKVVATVKCGQSETCEGITCHCEEVQSHEKVRPLNLSESHSILSNKVLVLTLISFIAPLAQFCNGEVAQCFP